MHQKVNVLILSISISIYLYVCVCPKRAVLKKCQVWPFSRLLLASLVFTSCSMCRRRGLQIFSHQFLQTRWAIYLYIFNVNYMWHVPCVAHWALFAMYFLSCGWVCSDQCLGIFLGIKCKDPSVSKCNQLHVDIFWFFFINLKYPWKNSCKMINNKRDVLNLNWLFLNLNRFICKQWSIP